MNSDGSKFTFDGSSNFKWRYQTVFDLWVTHQTH